MDSQEIPAQYVTGDAQPLLNTTIGVRRVEDRVVLHTGSHMYAVRWEALALAIGISPGEIARRRYMAQLAEIEAQRAAARAQKAAAATGG